MMCNQNPPQKVKSFLPVNNDTKILGIKHSKTCCIIDLSIYSVAKLDLSARERTGFCFFRSAVSRRLRFMWSEIL
jgi:hypothetical protein